MHAKREESGDKEEKSDSLGLDNHLLGIDFAEFWDRHHQILMRQFDASEEDLSDALADVYLELFIRLREDQPSRSRLQGQITDTKHATGYIVWAVKHRLIDRYRQRAARSKMIQYFANRVRPREADSNPESVADRLVASECKSELYQALATALTESERDLVQRYYFESHSLRQIAEEWGVSKSQISRLLRRAVESLRWAMQAHSLDKD